MVVLIRLQCRQKEWLDVPTSGQGSELLLYVSHSPPGCQTTALDYTERTVPGYSDAVAKRPLLSVCRYQGAGVRLSCDVTASKRIHARLVSQLEEDMLREVLPCMRSQDDRQCKGTWVTSSCPSTAPLPLHQKETACTFQGSTHVHSVGHIDSLRHSAISLRRCDKSKEAMSRTHQVAALALMSRMCQNICERSVLKGTIDGA